MIQRSYVTRESISPSICIVISYLNSKRTIQNCLTCLLRQDYPADRFKIIVVDGGSADGSPEIVDKIKCPNLTQIILPGCSEAEGQSVGIQATDSDVIMLTNSDIYVERDWIRKHVEWLNRGYDLVGGMVFWGGDKYALTWNTPTPAEPQRGLHQALGLGFSNCSFRRELLNRVGGILDMRSQQDMEFASRVLRYGGKMILDPLIVVYHDHPLGSLRASFKRAFVYARNQAIVTRRTSGKVVSGSRRQTLLPIEAIVKEVTLLQPVKAYMDTRARANEANIRVGLIQFLFIRLFTKLGQILGALAGASKGEASLEGMMDGHKLS